MNVAGRRRQGATAVLASMLAVALVAAAILGVIGYRGIRRYTAGKDVTRTFQVLPATPTGLWIMRAPDGTLGGLYVVVARPNQDGGHVVSIPTYASPAEATAPDSFADVYARDGEEALVLTVESALRLSFDTVLVSSPGDVASRLEALVPLTVDLPNDVTSAADGGEVTLQQGEHDLTADELAAVLASPGRGTNASRAGNVAAVLDSLAATVSARVAATPPATSGTTPDSAATTPPAPPVTDMASLLARVLRGPLDSKVLGTATSSVAAAVTEGTAVEDAVGDASTETTLDPAAEPLTFEIVDIAAAILVFGSIAPANMSTPSPGLNYSLTAPLGAESRVMDAIALILYLGGNVTRVQLTNAPPRAETVVYIYAERDRDRLATSNPLFGKVEFGKAETPIEGIDVLVELGKGFLDLTPQRPDPQSVPGTSASTDPGE